MYFVAGNHLEEIDIPIGRILDLRADRKLLGGRTDRTGDVAASARVLFSHSVDGLASAIDGRIVQIPGEFLGQFHFGHPDRGGAKGVGLDDIGPGLKIGIVNIGDRIGAGDAQEVTEANQILVVVCKSLTSHCGFVKFEPLDHCAHRPIEDMNAFSYKMKKVVAHIDNCQVIL